MAWSAQWMERAIELSRHAMQTLSGGPFGAVVVRDGVIVAEGFNQVISLSDPTAHAEIQAIRNACARGGDHRLEGCVMFSSCEPCPMCLGAIYWARIESVHFAVTRADAAAVGFDDAFIYADLARPPDAGRRVPLDHMEQSSTAARAVMDAWYNSPRRKPY